MKYWKGVSASKSSILFISILLLGSIILGSGCTDNGSKGGAGESRIVKAGDTVKVDYTGKLENGTVFDTSREEVAKQAGTYVNGRTYAPITVVVQYFTNWIRKSSSFIPISKYFSVKCLKS